MKKLIAIALLFTLLISLAACTPGATTATTTAANETTTTAPTETTKPMVGGTIMLLSNQSSGTQYDFLIAYYEMCCEQLGYDFTVVYGDQMNDPNGNLEAVKNGMTDDVVGLITMQDGGIINIMQEYPDLYVVSYANDAASVYSDGGPSAAAATMDHYLGGITDGYVSGVNTAADYFDIVKEKGYKKVSTVIFPAFAYPQLTVADIEFRRLVDEYNATAAEADKITVVGDTQVLMFQPIDSTYFLDATHQDLDAIIGFCAGVMFIYPGLKDAITAGTVSADTKLVTGGFDTDPNIIADIGGDGVIQGIMITPPEAALYPLALLDNAIQGMQFSDYTAKMVDSPRYKIDSKEAIDKVMNLTAAAAADLGKLQLPWTEMQKYFTRYNAAATYADLEAAMATLTVENIK